MLIDEKWVSVIQAEGLCNPVKLGSSSLLVEISYLVINKENRNNQEPGPILTGIFIEKYPLPNNHYAKNNDILFNPQNPDSKPGVRGKFLLLNQSRRRREASRPYYFVIITFLVSMAPFEAMVT